VLGADALLERSATIRSGWLRGLVAAVCAAGLAALQLAILRSTYPLIAETQARGLTGGENAYNNLHWNQNAALLFWEQNEPHGDYVLLSNDPDGAAFHTRHAVMGSPRRTTGPYGNEVMPVASFRSKIFRPGFESYLLWFEPGQYDYYYRPQELASIADIEILFSGEDGAVYRLLPLGET
jgi:hypothetical protein